jgi:hypothetical protein
MTSRPPVSDSDDIEIVSIHIASPSSGVSEIANPSRASKELMFMWKELSQSGVITHDSLRVALGKYDVIASDEQISDMISLFSETDNLTLETFKKILNRI